MMPPFTDQAELAALYRLHYRRVFFICRRIARNHADAEDLTQTVFLKLHSRNGQFRGVHFRAWIARVARNEALNFLRRKAGRLECPLLDLTIPDLSPNPIRALDIWRALDRLPARQRDALLLFHVAGFSYRQTAAKLGVSVGAVRSTLQRGRANLRSLLTGH